MGKGNCGTSDHIERESGMDADPMGILCAIISLRWVGQKADRLR